MIEMTAPPLPVLQDAVDALHARLTAGRTRATGTAIKSGLTGRMTDSTPEEFTIVEAVMGGRWSKQMLDIWSRDDLHVAGASEDDWALEREIAYHAITRGYEGERLALTVERIMRAGPYRAKWDEPRGAVTWLAQDVANAIETTQERLKKYRERYPDFPTDELGEHAEHPPADETLEQKVARLERELANARTVIAQQQTVIRAERAELESKTAFLSRVTSVLAKPNDEMSSTEKVVALVLAYEVHFRADRGRTKLPLSALVDRTGLSKNTVSTASRALTARDGSPFERRVTRDLVKDENGILRWETTVEFWPRTERTEDTLRTIAALPAAPDKPKHGGSPQAAAARWRRCPEHQDDDVLVRGVCSTCGKVVGERRMSAQEWQVLNHQDCDSDGETVPPVSVSLPITHQLWDSDGATVLNHQDADPAPVSIDQVRIERRTENGVHVQEVIVPEDVRRRDVDTTGACRHCGEYTTFRTRSGVTSCSGCGQTLHIAPWAAQAPWRCACGSYERYPRSGGDWRCDGCGHVEVPAVKGASE